MLFLSMPPDGLFVGPLGMAGQFAGLKVIESPHLYAGQVYFIKRPKLDLMRDMVIDWRLRPTPRTDDMRQMIEDLAAERWRN